ncbi:hypothetical protein D9601_14885 [Sphingomonas sp. MA1305]|uniref:hypothetical protein n=1 Tax=Sphingomonas sp. MA1305 TaxID=2479204 RepID=UPI0018E016B4|nr:hypothetical protein [Sphingomonas sp. MA1305]MBI0476634.1 hypothetical protein [Sphingomonas sp. MA1305]
MTDDATPSDQPAATGAASRRRVLMLGAVTAGAVVSIRPALAQTAGSVMNCEIPVPDMTRAGGYIDPDGNVVPAGTKGAFAPPARPFKGEDVKRALAGGMLPGTTYETNRAYISYIRRLQRGQGGFTCFASLQMPRA